MNDKKTIYSSVRESIKAKEAFFSSTANVAKLVKAADTIIAAYKKGGKVIIFGNGGSASDSEHMAAELVVRFEKERKALPCVALTANTANLTAAGNDYSFDDIFSRQIEALGKKGDVVIAISTSGNSPNVLNAVQTARKMGLKTIALGGKDGGKLAGKVNIALVVGHNSTARVQETHILIIHILCKLIEEAAPRK